MENLSYKKKSFMKMLAVLFMLYPFTYSLMVYKFGFSVWSNMDELLVILLLIGNVFYYKGKIVIPRSFRYYLILIFLWIMIGMLPIVTRSLSWNVILKGAFFHIKNYLVFYLIYCICWDEDDLKSILKYLKWIYLFVILVGYVTYFIPSLKLFDLREMSSIFSHQGLFATLMVPVGIFGLVYYVQTGKYQYLVLLGIVMECLLLAGTSKNIVSIVVVCGLYILKVKKRRKYDFLIFVIALSVVVLPDIISIFSEEIATNILSDTALNRPRWLLWLTSFKIVSDFFPLGSGFGTFASSISSTNENYSIIYQLYGLSSRYGFRKDEVYFLQDTYWPSVIGETGIFGLIIVVLILFYILKFAINLHSNLLDDKLKVIGSVIILSFIALMIESLFTATFFGLRSYLGIGMLAVYCSIVNKRMKS